MIEFRRLWTSSFVCKSLILITTAMPSPSVRCRSSNSRRHPVGEITALGAISAFQRRHGRRGDPPPPCYRRF